MLISISLMILLLMMHLDGFLGLVRPPVWRTCIGVSLFVSFLVTIVSLFLLALLTNFMSFLRENIWRDGIIYFLSTRLASCVFSFFPNPLFDCPIRCIVRASPSWPALQLPPSNKRIHWYSSHGSYGNLNTLFCQSWHISLPSRGFWLWLPRIRYLHNIVECSPLKSFWIIGHEFFSRFPIPIISKTIFIFIQSLGVSWVSCSPMFLYFSILNSPLMIDLGLGPSKKIV